MTNEERQSIERMARGQRTALACAGVALAAAAILAWFNASSAAAAWRFAAFACLGPSLGSLLFLLIHRLTGGQWGDGLAPFLSAGLRLLPWVWLIALPMIFFPLVTPMHAIETPVVPSYNSRAFFAVRSVAYGVVFFLLAGALGRRRADPRGGWLAPAGLVGIVFLLHLLADDWLVALVPRWNSTGFPLVWMSGQAVSGLAAATLAGLAFGIDPSRKGTGERALGLDLGNLLFAATLFWGYVSFAQFLIIWSGDMPKEISWYHRRIEGAWHYIPAVLVGIHLVLPLGVLLSRRAKRSKSTLAGVAVLLVAAQFLYTAWLVLPAYPDAGTAGLPLCLAAAVGAGALFANRYLAAVRRNLEAA